MPSEWSEGDRGSLDLRIDGPRPSQKRGETLKKGMIINKIEPNEPSVVTDLEYLELRSLTGQR